MRKFLSDIMTGKDGKTYDVARFLWVISFLMYAGLTFYAIFKGASYTFDPLIWASGVAAMAGGYGASIYAKAGTEPEAMMIKTDKMTFKQSVGRPPIGGGCDDGDDAPTDASAPPTPPDDDPTATATISATITGKSG